MKNTFSLTSSERIWSVFIGTPVLQNRCAFGLTIRKTRPREWFEFRATSRLFAVIWMMISLITTIASGEPVVLQNTNFDNATAGTYSNSTIINSGRSSTEQLTVVQGAPQVIQVVNIGGTNQALQFVDNSTGSPGCYVKTVFAPISTTASGYNNLVGSFSITPWGGSSGANPELDLLINAGVDTAGSAVTAIQLQFRGGGAVAYKTNSGSASGPVLSVGVKYNVSVYADFSSSTNDTWGFTITNAGTGSVLFTINGLTTRAANIAPDRIVFNAGVNAGDANATPFIQIDDVNFALSQPETPLTVTNFDNATPGIYANGTIINSGRSAIEQLSVAQASPQSVQVVNVSGTNQALQFIDNSTSSSNCYVKSSFTPLSTTISGTNYIIGSFSVTPLGGASGSNPECHLLVNAGGDTAGSTITAAQMMFRGNGTVSYKAASGFAGPTVPALAVGAKYKVSVYLDLSSTTQDTYGFTITDGTGGIVATINNIPTRAANIAPDRIVFNAAANTAETRESPFFQIDDLKFAACSYDVSLNQGPYYSDSLLLTSFSNAALGTYLDRGVLNAGQAIQERLGVNVTSPQAIQVIDIGGGKRAVMFTDNSTSIAGSPLLKKGFAPLSTSGTGNNYMVGTFELTPLAFGPTLSLQINAGSDTGNAASTAVDFQVGGGGLVSYYNGSTLTSGPSLSVGVTYLVSVYLDLSSAMQDRWGFEISLLDATLVGSVNDIYTRAPNVAPDRVVFNGGISGAGICSSPFIQLGSMQFVVYANPTQPAIPQIMGGANITPNGETSSTTQAQFQVLSDLGIGTCRLGLYPFYYWNYDNKKGLINTPNTITVESQILMAHDYNVTPSIIYLYYGWDQSTAPLGDYNRWYQIGHDFAAKYGPNSSWLTSQGITNWGVTNYYAFNEPDTIGGGPNTPPIPISGTVSYHEAIRGLADGVHSVNTSYKVFPGGFARPTGYSDWTCNGYAAGIADLLNDGHLDGITLHTYWCYSMATYGSSSQYMFDHIKSACGITRDINFYCDEYNYVLNTDTQTNAALYYLAMLWDSVGVVGNNGQPVSKLSMPWNLPNTETSDSNYGMCTQLMPSWVPTPRGSVFQMVATLTAGMQIISADPKGTGEYKLMGNNQTMWVWQNWNGWTNHPGTTYTVRNIPLYATTLKVYNSTSSVLAPLRTIPLSGHASYQVTGLTVGNTYMFVVDSQP